MTDRPMAAVCRALHVARATGYLRSRPRKGGFYRRAEDTEVPYQILFVTKTRASYGYPPRGVPTRTYCSESCAERAHVRATRMQWAGNQATVDSSGRCSQCSGAIREIPGWVMDLESRPKK